MPSITEENGTNHFSPYNDAARDQDNNINKFDTFNTYNGLVTPPIEVPKKEPFSTLCKLLLEAREEFAPISHTLSGNKPLREMSKELRNLFHKIMIMGIIIEKMELHGAWYIGENARSFVDESQKQLGDLSNTIQLVVDEIRRYKNGLEPFTQIGALWRQVIWSVMLDLGIDLHIENVISKANQCVSACIESILQITASLSAHTTRINPKRKSPPRHTGNEFGQATPATSPKPGGEPNQTTPSTTTQPRDEPDQATPSTTPDDAPTRAHPSRTPDDAPTRTHPLDHRAAHASFDAFNSLQGAIVESPVINQAARDQTMTTIQNQNINPITMNVLSSPFSTILSFAIFDAMLWKQSTIQPSFTTEVLNKLLAMLQDAAGLIAPAAVTLAATVVTAVLYERSMASLGQYMLIE